RRAIFQMRNSECGARKKDQPASFRRRLRKSRVLLFPRFPRFNPPMRKSTFLTTVLTFVAALTLHAQDIVVGEFASLTGGSASFGQSSHKGTQLAIDELNAAGGVLGKKLKLVTEDDQSLAGQPATIARKLISQDKIVALLGEVASSKSLEAA